MSAAERWFDSLSGGTPQRFERDGYWLRQAILARCAESPQARGLLDWARHYLPHYFTRPPSAMHRWLEAQLARAQAERGAKLNVIGPRGSAKSTIGALAWPLRLALEGCEPYIWIVSDTGPQAWSHLEHIKAELLGNARLRADYPHAAGRGKRWRRGAITLLNGAVIEAFGAGQRLRGRRHGAHRPSVIVADDLQNDQHITSAPQRERSRRWFHGALLNSGTARTNVVNLATALHSDALALELHRTPGWISRVFAAVERWPREQSLWQAWEALYTDMLQPDHAERAREFYEAHAAEMNAGARLLWPQHEDLYTLMCLRVESGRAAFDREKQGAPASSELCEWPDEYFDDSIWFDQWPSDNVLRVVALDPSKGSDAAQGDYSAYVLLAIDARGMLYAEADLARRPTPQMVADGVELVRRFQPQALGVEANQFQDLLAPLFVSEFAARGLFATPPWLLHNSVAKAVRIRRLGPYLARRQLRFKRDSPSTRLLVRQLQDFPHGDHDDGPDALEMAMRLAADLLGREREGDKC